MKRLAQIVAAVLVTMLVVLAALPFTAVGTRILLGLVPASSPLQLDYHSGSLLGELRLRHLQLELDSLNVEISDWRSRLRPGCLWQSEFCLDQLAIGAVAVVVAAQEGDAQSGHPDAAASADMLTLPVRLRAPSIQIEELQVQWPGGRWRQGQLQLGMTAGGSTVRVDKLHIAGAELELEDTGTVAAATDPEPVVLPELFLPLELVIEDLQLSQLRLRSGELVQALESVSLQGSWRGRGLEVGALDVSSEEWGALNLQGELELGGAWPLALDAAFQLARPQAVPELVWERRLLLRLEGQPDALQLFMTVPGAPRAELRGRADLLDPELPFDVTATLAGDRQLPLAEVAGMTETLPDLALELPLQLRASGNLAGQSLEATATLLGAGHEALRLEAEVSHRDQRLQIDRLQLVDRASDSSLLIDGSGGYGAGLEWQLALRSSGFTLPALNGPLSGRLEGSLAMTGAARDQNWELALTELDLRGEVNGLPAHASGGLQLNNRDYVAAGELQVDINDAQLVVSRGQGNGATAALVVRIADLARWQKDGRGRILLEGELREEASRVALKGSVANLAWNGLAIDRGELQGDLALVAGGELDASLALEQVQVGDLALNTVRLLARGTYDAPRVELQSSGDIAGAVRVVARADNGQWSAELTSSGIDTPLGPLAPEQPVAINYYRDGRAEVAAHCWQLPASRLCSEEWTLAASGGGSARLEGDLALFAALLPQQLEVAGELVVAVTAQWEPATGVRASATLDSADGELTQFYAEGESASFRWESLQATLEQGGEGLAVSATLRREQQTALQVDLRLPAEREQELEGRIEVNRFQLAALRPFVPDLSHLAGVLAGNLRLAGTVSAPELFGRLQLSGAELGLHGNPTELKDIELAVDLNGDRASLEGGAMLGGGALALTGSAGLRPEPTLELQLKGQRNALLYPPSTRVEASPDLQLRVNADELVLRGEVQVHSGVLAYEQLPAGSVAISSDVVQVDYDGNPLTADAGLALDAQLRVRINDEFRVRGKDLKVTVGGDLSLEQSPGRPLQIFGNLNVIGGEFRAYGQRLLVRQGRISFTGLPENPELNLRAERDIPADDVTAGVVVSGTLEEPRLQVYSEPAMSQTEALSYLVRGRGLDSGAGADGTAMALSVGTGLVNQSAVVEGLNRLPGLRNVEFGTAGSDNETAATVSGYIGERIYVSYGVGLYEPVNALTARLYLQARLWLEVVSRLESSVDLYYSFDID